MSGRESAPPGAEFALAESIVKAINTDLLDRVFAEYGIDVDIATVRNNNRKEVLVMLADERWLKFAVTYEDDDREVTPDGR